MADTDTLYISDLDGTLLGPDGRISPRSREILNGLIDAGVQFTVATARTPATVVGLLEGLRLRLPAVLMTGTLLYDVAERTALAAKAMTPHALDAVCTLLDATGQEAILYCEKDNHLTAYYRRLSGRFEREFVAERTGSPYKTFVQTDSFAGATRGCRVLVALLCLDDAAGAARWYRAFSQLDDVDCFCYVDNYGKGYTVEVYPAGCSKATGLAAVKQLCGARRVVCFGDNLNDLPLFAAADRALAVGNACAEAKQAAGEVIGANSADGVALWMAANARPEGLS